MHKASYGFLTKAEESARCHQTLSSQVGSGDETNPQSPICQHYTNSYAHMDWCPNNTIIIPNPNNQITALKRTSVLEAIFSAVIGSNSNNEVMCHLKKIMDETMQCMGQSLSMHPVHRTSCFPEVPG